jgi:hypothetical protein
MGKPGDVHHVYLNLFLNIAGLGFGDGRKVTLWAEEDLFAVNFSSLLGHEITRPDWTILEFEAFEEILTRAVPEGSSELQELLHFARDVHGSEELDDDFSIIKMTI